MKLTSKKANSHLNFEESFRIQLKSKCSDERYMSPIMFLIWAIIAISIIAGIIMFYPAEIDTRSAEANLLADKVVGCLNNGFDYAKLTGGSFDIYAECKLSKTAIETTDKYYVQLTIFDATGKEAYSVFWGDKTFEVKCLYQKDNAVEKNFPQCAFKSVSVSDKNTGKQYTLSIMAASNQK